MVREFHDTYGCPSRDTPSVDVTEAPMRLALITEEARELREAVDAGDIIETADALADLAYVVYGAALTFGIDLDAVLVEVHRSNMSKLGPDGRPIYRYDGKVLKGPNFSPPDLAPILRTNGHHHVTTHQLDATEQRENR
jgi:predicted HAD superfamily Cof-like phosphohydrolase